MLIAPQPFESSILCQHYPWLLSPITIKICRNKKEIKTRWCSLNEHHRRHVCIVTMTAGDSDSDSDK